MKKTLITTTLVVGLALTACGSDSEAASESSVDPIESESPTPIEEPTPEQNLSERGSIILEQGEEGHVIDEQDNELVTFTVNNIEINPECTGQRAKEPENGAFVMFEAEIESDLAAGEHYIEPGLFFNPYSYRAIDTEGVTRSESVATMASFDCLPESELIPSDIGPGEKASGKVVFDVPTDARTLLMDLDIGQNLQWEWSY